MDFEELKDKKPKRLLKNFNFKTGKGHLAVTDGENGGAASLKNEAYLFKSMEQDSSKEFSDADIAEENNTGVEKSAMSDTKEKTDNKDDLMSEEMMKAMADQIEALQKQLADKDHEVAVEKAATSFGKYEFEAELVKEASEAFQGDKAELVVKMLDAVVAAKDVAIEKAKEAVAPENEIAKALSQEKADGGEPEEIVEKTVVEKTMDVLKSKLEKK